SPSGLGVSAISAAETRPTYPAQAPAPPPVPPVPLVVPAPVELVLPASTPIVPPSRAPHPASSRSTAAQAFALRMSQSATDLRSSSASCSSWSVARQPSEAIAVVGRSPEGHLRHARPLEEEPDVELVGDAGPPVHLHGLR